MDSRSEDKYKNNTDDGSTNRVESLPHEVALDIFSRLPVTSLMRSRFVSPSLQNLTYDPNLINLHCSQTAKNNTCLIFHHSFPFGNQLYFVDFSEYNKKTVVRKFQTPFPTPMPRAEFNVVGSANGLICLSYSREHDKFQICNPFTRSYKNLPPISNMFKFNVQRVVVGFGYHPVTKEYKVVRIVYYAGRSPAYGLSEVQVYSLVYSDWTSIGMIPYQIGRYSTEPLLVKGRLHWLTRFDDGGEDAQRLISFDIDDERFREVSTPTWNVKPRYFYPLALLGGCLSMLVHPSDKKLEIWVMKEYSVIESWSKEYELIIDGPCTRVTGMWNTSLQSLACHVLCLTEDRRILLMRNGALASYDPESGKVENVVLEGALDSFQAVVHEGSLAWIDNI